MNHDVWGNGVKIPIRVKTMEGKTIGTIETFVRPGKREIVLESMDFRDESHEFIMNAAIGALSRFYSRKLGGGSWALSTPERGGVGEGLFRGCGLRGVTKSPIDSAIRNSPAKWMGTIK